MSFSEVEVVTTWARGGLPDIILHVSFGTMGRHDITGSLAFCKAAAASSHVHTSRSREKGKLRDVAHVTSPRIFCCKAAHDKPTVSSRTASTTAALSP